MRTPVYTAHGSGRNGYPQPGSLHQISHDANQLTLGGKVIYLRTRRPVATCNALAEIACIGQPVEVR